MEHHQVASLHCQRSYAAITATLVLLLVAGLTGCTRSLRPDAMKIAKAGSLNAKQMADYYEALQQDVVDTYELDAFRKAYLLQSAYDKAVKAAQAAVPPRPTPTPPQPNPEAEKVENALFDNYQKTYEAMVARKRLAQAMQNAYDSYGNLSEYNAVQEVLKGVDTIIGAVNTIAPFPTAGAGAVVASTAGAIIKDIARELETVKQNKKLLQESNVLLPVLKKLKIFFDSELILYGDNNPVPGEDGKPVRDTNGNVMMVLGIAGDRARAYRAVAEELVESDSVISTALVSRVLNQYQLRWPDSQVPFAQSPMKAGILKIIRARAKPLAQISDKAGKSISNNFGKIITLHEELLVKKPLSLDEFLSGSATAQVFLDQLKTTGIPVDALRDLLWALENGTR